MHVFYNPRTTTTIDIAVLRGGHYVGEISGEDLATLQRRHPDAVLDTYERVAAMREATMKTDPAQITAQDYDDAFNILPPHDASADVRGASFKSSERTAGDLTTIYAQHRASGTYWSFTDRVSLRHDAIMRRIADHAPGVTNG